MGAYLVAIFVRTIGLFVRILPSALAFAFARILSWIFYIVDGRHRRIARDNLRAAFPEKNEKEIRKLTKKVFGNFGFTAIEFLRIPRTNIDDIPVEGLEHVEKARERGKGTIFIGAHFGNWEIAAQVLGRRGIVSGIIVRPLDSRRLESVVSDIRNLAGARYIPKKGSGFGLVSLIKRNKGVGILIDQCARRDAVAVDFFGRPASTTSGAATLALRTDAAVLAACAIRTKPGEYKMYISPAIELVRTDDNDVDIRTNTARFTAEIEKQIRHEPDQWFWVHRRWKLVGALSDKNNKKTGDDTARERQAEASVEGLRP